MKIKFDKYKGHDLHLKGNEVWSYKAHIATIADAKLFPTKSMDMSFFKKFHLEQLSYVANQLDLKLKK
tara:strand:+ start:784 stop:987 length:204 start_codon:yes stop_codon:yes gene_type:complete